MNLDRSVNCYQCAALVDERLCFPNTAEYGGNDDGGSLCMNCVADGRDPDEEEVK